MESVESYFKFFLAMAAIVNPFGAVPIFLNACSDESLRDKKKTIKTAATTVFFVLFISLVSGEAILKIFGISMASFRVAGGILILLMAFSMLQAKVSPAKQTQEEAEILESNIKENIAVVPLGIPLMAGPGAISTVILYAQKHETFSHYAVLLGIILSIALISWSVLRIAPAIASRLGQTGINIITRIMGLLMASIGIEFMANGLKMLFPVLTSLL
ncbi:MAG: YchE family NAAT transporter [Desulfobacteraceae bacterium]|nr:YchE family NAAT transporter [Desulfobacteraceae bacterium]MCB9494711.1 YchE family NAAT transporter [Desulfobacteraceae bacterium]